MKKERDRTSRQTQAAFATTPLRTEADTIDITHMTVWGVTSPDNTSVDDDITSVMTAGAQ